MSQELNRASWLIIIKTNGNILLKSPSHKNYHYEIYYYT